MVNFSLKGLFTFFLLLLITAGYSQGIPKVKFGKGIYYEAKDSSFDTKFNLRFQNLYVATYDESSESYSSQFLVRRARFKFSGYAFSKNLTYKTEFGLSNRDISVNSEDGNGRGASRVILDAVIKWKFSKHWSLWAGQTKLPGNRERVISSADLQFVDRSLVNSRYNIDRDVGLQLRGKYEIGEVILAPSFALSQGEGRNITSTNFGGYDYTFHVDFLPLGKFSNKKGDYVSSDLERNSEPKIAIGLTYNINDRAVRQGGQLGKFVRNSDGEYAENTMKVFFADLMFKHNGFSILSEYAHKTGSEDFTDLSSKFRTGSGFTFQAGYLTNANLEIAGRFTTVAADNEFSGVRDENQYTLGLSKYIVGHSLKIQTDITRITFDDSNDGRWQYRMQVEMQF